MTTPTSTQPPRAGFAQRYGPLLGIVVAIAAVATLVTVVGRDDEVSSTTGTGPGTTPGGAQLPLIYEQARSQGREQSITWVANCDTSTGRVKMPTIFAYPCVPAFSGSNGGATGTGVTADKVTVVWYLPSPNADIQAQLSGNLDTPEASQATITRMVEILNDVAETYGRTVEVVFYQGKSSGNDPVGARAEAQEIIDQHKPFASINGPALTPAYAEELAAQGVVCIACGQALSNRAFEDNAPYLWGAAPSPEQWLTIVSNYLGNRLAGRPARWAGDPSYRNATRKIGIVNYEQDPPQFSAIRSTGQACESVTKWKAAVQETYLTATMTERAPTIIAKLKNERVTTVVFMGDPVMPIFLTAEATKQGYFPEWIVTGTVLTDTASLARRYDQRQWEHAFGLSPLAATVDRNDIDGNKLYRWYFGEAPQADKTAAILWPSLFQLFAGIHMAGPSLSAEMFKNGMFNLPPAGGGPTTPRVSYGDRKIFPVVNSETCKVDRTIVDYLGSDDMVEIWWDPSYTGPDEQGTDGRGKYRFANGGRRYLPGQMPETEPDAFKVEGSVLEFKPRPDVDRAPDYPSPRR